MPGSMGQLALQRAVCVAVLFHRGTGWLVCTSADSCEPTWDQWQRDPAELADEAAEAQLPWGAWMPAEVTQAVGVQWSQRPPLFGGRPVLLRDVAAFVTKVLSEDTFHTGDRRRVPWLNFADNSNATKVVVLTQRQLAFLVANVLMGNVMAAETGLQSTLRACAGRSPPPVGAFFSLLSLLAVLSAELRGGSPGKMLVGATPGGRRDDWRPLLAARTLREPTICAREAGGPDCGLPDFMAGGTAGQAVTDLAVAGVGGGDFACEPGERQDGSLLLFYSEVLAFHFFLGPSDKLPVPWALLGARRYMGDVGGQAGLGAPFYGRCGALRLTNWLNEAIPAADVQVALDKDLHARVPAGAFVAVGSALSACVGSAGQCEAGEWHLDEDVARWYQALEPTMYHPAVQEAFRAVVRRVGSGPWGVGPPAGDSQHAFVAAWIATALLSQDASLDYYVYSRFCDSPGLQCPVLGQEACRACLANSSQGHQGPLPVWQCGRTSVHEVARNFKGAEANALYRRYRKAKSMGLPKPRTLFDSFESGFMWGLRPPSSLGLLGSQRWSWVRAGALQSGDGRCLDAATPDVAGSSVLLTACQPSLRSQLWAYDPQTRQLASNAGLCIETGGLLGNGTEPRLKHCDAGSAGQRWRLRRGQAVDAHGRCLDIPAGSSDSGAVHLWACLPGAATQRWAHKGNETFLRDWHGVCLATPKHAELGSAIEAGPCRWGELDEHPWHFVPSPLNQSDGLLTNGAACLGAHMSARAGSSVDILPCSPEDARQHWVYEMEGGLLRHHAQLCLDAPGSDGGHPRVQLWWCNAALEHASWAREDGAGLLRNRKGYCLEAPRPDVEGSEVRLAPCHLGRRTQWWEHDERTGLLRTGSGSCLAGGTAAQRDLQGDGTLEIRRCNEADEGQQWTYNLEAAGTLRLQPDLCIVSSDFPEDIGKVFLTPCPHGQAVGQWV